MGVGQSDTANNTLCRYYFQGEIVLGQKVPGAPVFGHFLLFFSQKNPVYRESNSRPNVSEGYEVIPELPGRPAL